MAEEDLKKTILEKIKTEKEALLSQTKQEYDKILSQARQEASSLKEGYLSQIRSACLLKKSREFNKTNIELRQQLLEAQEEKISEVFALVKENLKTIQKDRGRYKSIFRCLLREALTQPIDRNTGLKLKVNPSDKELALDVLKELKVEVKIETEESIEAGLQLSNSEESIIILNTFSSRLTKLELGLRQEINKILFSEYL